MNSTMEDYLKDPRAIEEKSFALIRRHTDLSGFSDLQQQVVMRLVHTCGNPEIARAVRMSEGAVGAGIAALRAQCNVLCDVEMVRQGVARRYWTKEPLCFLHHPEVEEKAISRGESRTMTAVHWWRPCLQDGIVLIGNAPTALFRLMEMLEQGAPRPALIIGMPVGFVGAPESKSYLWTHHRSLECECITLLGRAGGSAMAAGAFNSLARLQHGVRH